MTEEKHETGVLINRDSKKETGTVESRAVMSPLTDASLHGDEGDEAWPLFPLPKP